MNKNFAGMMAVTIMAVGIGFFAISNVAHAASTSTLNVIFFVDNSAGGTASPSDFSVNATGVLGGLTVTSTFPGGSSPTAITVDADTPYSVSVSSLPNYTLENFSDCSGTTAPAGSSVGCVITEQFVSTSTSCVATTTYQNPSLAQLTIASSAIGETLGASTTNDLAGAWTFTAYNSPVLLNNIKFTVIGSASDSNLQNVKLVVNGTQVGATLSSVAQNGTASFTASSGTLATLTTGNNDIQLFADVVGSPSKNFQFEIANASDVSAADGHYCNAPIQTNANDGTLITIEQGQLTTTQDPTTPSGNIPVGEASVTLAKFDLYATNEPLNLKFLDFNLNLTGVSASTTLSDQIQNVSLFDGNGVQIGSTIHVPPSGNTCTAPIAPSGYTSLGSGNSTITNSNVTYADCFGTPSSPISYTIPMNATTVLYLKADIETTANFDTVRAALSGDTDNLQGASSDATSSMSAADGNVLTLVKTEMVASPNSALGTPSVSAGASDVEIGSYAISASVAEGINVNSASVELSPQGTPNSPSDIFQNLKLMVNGTQFGATRSVLAQGATYTFSGTPFNIPASGTVDVDVYADILSSATSSFASEYQPATLLDDVSGTGVITNNTISSSILTTGQNLSLGGGGTPTQLPVASFTFSPQNPEAGQTVTFDASGSNSPNGQIVNYEWDWNGDGNYEYNSPTPTALHSWPFGANSGGGGTYTVTLRVTDSSGAEATTSAQVVLQPSPSSQIDVDEAAIADGVNWGAVGNAWSTFWNSISGQSATLSSINDWLTANYDAYDDNCYTAKVTAPIPLTDSIDNSVSTSTWMQRYDYCNGTNYQSLGDNDLITVLNQTIPSSTLTYEAYIENSIYEENLADQAFQDPLGSQDVYSDFAKLAAGAISTDNINGGGIGEGTSQLASQISEYTDPLFEVGNTTVGFFLDGQNVAKTWINLHQDVLISSLGNYLTNCGIMADGCTASTSLSSVLGDASAVALKEQLTGTTINNSEVQNYFYNLYQTYYSEKYPYPWSPNTPTEAGSFQTTSVNSPRGITSSFKQYSARDIAELIIKALINNAQLLPPEVVADAGDPPPIELSVVDANGNTTGLVNGQTTTAIPLSVYDPSDDSVIIFNPQNSLQYNVVGTASGTYGLTFTLASGTIETFSLADVSTTASTTDAYSVDWNEGNNGGVIALQADLANGTNPQTVEINASTTSIGDIVLTNLPAASPIAGIYTSAQSVTLTATGASSINYTTDDSIPTCLTGTTYTSPISVGSSETINAIACYASSTPSDVASFAYTINIPAPITSSGGGGSVAVSSGGGGGGGFYTPIPPANTSTNSVGVVLGASTTNPVALAQALQNLEQQLVTLEFKANSCPFVFNRNLSKGVSGIDVKNLQTALNYTPLTQVAQAGIGSPSDESTYFGNATKNAVIALQNIFANQILAPLGLASGNGYVGSATRAVLNGLCGQQ